MIVRLAAQRSTLFHGRENSFSDSAVNVAEWFPRTQLRANSLTPVVRCRGLFMDTQKLGNLQCRKWLNTGESPWRQKQREQERRKC